MKVKSDSEVAQLCPILSNPMDCSLPFPSPYAAPEALLNDRREMKTAQDYRVKGTSQVAKW